MYDSEGEIGTKEYTYAPLFLRQARAIMGDEEFFACLKDVYNTYSYFKDKCDYCGQRYGYDYLVYEKYTI